MFKSQTLIKQQQVIDTLNQENEAHRKRIEALEEANESLHRELEQIRKSKDEAIHVKEKEVQRVEASLNHYKEEKTLLKEAKAHLEARYHELLEKLGRFKSKVEERDHDEQVIEEQGMTVMENELDQLLGQVEEFQKSVQVIKKIANELELLGVNATIQAAHAGEKGKGFLIVADQINKLSLHSKKNVEEALHQLKLFTQITRGLTSDFSRTVASIENNMNAFHELNALMNEELSEIKKEHSETSDRM